MSEPDMAAVDDWSVDDVHRFFAARALPGAAAAFRTEAVDGEKLMQLDGIDVQVVVGREHERTGVYDALAALHGAGEKSRGAAGGSKDGASFSDPRLFATCLDAVVVRADGSKAEGVDNSEDALVRRVSRLRRVALLVDAKSGKLLAHSTGAIFAGVANDDNEAADECFQTPGAWRELPRDGSCAPAATADGIECAWRVTHCGGAGALLLLSEQREGDVAAFCAAENKLMAEKRAAAPATTPKGSAKKAKSAKTASSSGSAKAKGASGGAKKASPSPAKTKLKKKKSAALKKKKSDLSSNASTSDYGDVVDIFGEREKERQREQALIAAGKKKKKKPKHIKRAKEHLERQKKLLEGELANLSEDDSEDLDRLLLSRAADTNETSSDESSSEEDDDDDDGDDDDDDEGDGTAPAADGSSSKKKSESASSSRRASEVGFNTPGKQENNSSFNSSWLDYDDESTYDEARGGKLSASGKRSDSKAGIFRRPRGSTAADSPLSAAPGAETDKKGIPLSTQLTINLQQDSVLLLERLAEGTMSKVYRASVGGVQVALKQLLVDFQSEAEREALRQSTTLAETLQHTNIVRHVGHQFDGTVYNVFVELMDGTLRQEIDARESLPPPKVLAEQAGQVALGLMHIGAFKIIHRDIKSDNVFVQRLADGQAVLKIGDFDDAVKCAVDNEALEANVGTPGFMAPELISRKKGRGKKLLRYDERADIFSFGMMIFELLTGELPYSKVHMLDVHDHVSSGKRPDWPEHFTPPDMDKPDWARDQKSLPTARLVKLHLNCTELEPEARPDIKTIVEELKNLWRKEAAKEEKEKEAGKP